VAKLNIQQRERVVWTSLYTVLVIFWAFFFFTKYSLQDYIHFFQVPLTMVFGSFLGGFTCEGGGAVAFPVFTKVLHVPPPVCRDFSFAIQSIGMTFASITMLLRKIPIEKRVIVFAVIGGIIGILLGTLFIVPYVTSAQAKLIFTLVVTSFGISLFLKNFVFKMTGKREILHFKKRDAFILIASGIIGGIFSSIIGTGVHFIIFSIVTLLYRLDEKIATPTSIMIMACDSVFGFFLRGAVLHQISGDSMLYWALCIPVAALTAPLGTIMCSKVSRLFIVKFLLFLIGVEFVSSLFIFQLDFATVSLSVIVIIVSFGIYGYLIQLSKKFVDGRIDFQKTVDEKGFQLKPNEGDTL
jgi:uncharacterized membrane protein YfcA